MSADDDDEERLTCDGGPLDGEIWSVILPGQVGSVWECGRLAWTMDGNHLGHYVVQGRVSPDGTLERYLMWVPIE